ncbi:MAG: peptidoglycan/LPS O-acetylase OafA/YrhL [Yoonia sp.]|jgi:peptidoglycan/LPS O-acetylase OafA/YrhL
MNRGFSVWLDVLRAGATLLVVFSHFAYPRFTDGTYQWMRDYNLGSDAVVVFFVVSGLVIAFAANRDGNGGTYAFNRLTRLWSVLIPALILTIIFDRIGIQANPASYPTGFFEPHSTTEFMLRGISFSNEFRALDRLRLGTNGPLWSLSYEAAYYALFGIAIFMSGAKRTVLLVAVAAFVGLPILMLMPAWLMGVWAWKLIKSNRVDALPVSTALIYAIGAPVAYVVMQWADTPSLLLALSTQAFGVNMNATYGFSDEFVWNALIGGLCVAHLIGMARLLQTSKLDLPFTRWIAGGSFSLYVTHYPSLHLLDAVLPDLPGREPMLLIGTLIIGLAFAELFERRIKSLRHILRKAITAFSPPKANALDSTTSTDASRASLGTTSSAHSGSGSS